MDQREINLFRTLLDEGKDVVISVSGGSMAPFVKAGCRVIIRRIPAKRLLPGDIVFALQPGKSVVLHRIVWKKTGPSRDYIFYLAGDNNRFLDAKVSAESILGCAVEIIDSHGQRICYRRSFFSKIYQPVLALWLMLKISASRLKNKFFGAKA